MKDELKKEIAKLYVSNQFDKYILVGDREDEEFADSILSLLTPTIEKAEKWDKVKEIAKLADYSCEKDYTLCPFRNICNKPEDCICVPIKTIVEALEGCQDGKTNL